MKKISKIMSIVLTIAMLIGMVPAFADNATVTISSSSGNFPTLVGSKIVITASVDAPSAESLEFYENGKLVATVEDLSGTINYDATVGAGTKKITAKIKDIEGYVLATSNELNVVGSIENVNDVMWDIDFEDEKFLDINPSYPEYRYLADANGNRLSISRGGAESMLTAHTGSTANTMWVEETGDADHGKAIKMTTAVVNQNQFNDFRATNAGDVIKSEWDVKFTVIPPKQEHLRAHIHEVNIAANGAGNTVKTIQTFGVKYVDSTPYIYTVADDKIIEELVEDKWYNTKAYLDTANEVIYCYLNDKFVSSISIAETVKDWPYLYSWKYKVDLYYAIGTEVWVDNFKVEKLTFADSTPTVVISSDANGATIPAGSKAKINIDTTNGAAVASYDVLASTDGTNFSKVSTVAANAVSANVEAKSYPVYYKLAALDAEGNTLATSDSVEITGAVENIDYYAWDMNFDEEGMCILNNGLYAYPSLDGQNAYTPRGDSFSCHIGGNTGNTVTIEDSSAISGDDNGNSLVLTTRDKDYNCQVNSGWAQIYTNTAVYSVDIATTTKSYKNLLDYVLDGADLIGVAADANGNVLVGTEIVGTYEVNKWMNIKYMFDITTGVADIFLDNVHVKRIETNHAGKAAKRMCIRNSTSANTVTYIDNVKAYRMVYSEPQLDLADVSYVVNGVKTEDIKSGALNVSVSVSNNGDGRDLICFVAVYSGDSLLRCYPVEVSFGDGDTNYSFTVDAGTINAATDTVKTMLWYGDISTPVCQSVELN